MVRALPFRHTTRLDFGRVLAMAAAIALHMLALLLLLMPMAAPQLARIVQPSERWQIPVQRVLPPPLPPEPVAPREPETIRRVPQEPVAIPVAPAVPDSAPIIDQGTLPATDTIGPVANDIGPVDTSPMTGSQLRYVKAPAPPYPRAEQRAGVTGTVVLRILVDVDGVPLEVSVETSSGNRNLDREARQHVLKHWRFQPAVRDGVAVQAYGLVPIEFALR